MSGQAALVGAALAVGALLAAALDYGLLADDCSPKPVLGAYRHLVAPLACRR